MNWNWHYRPSIFSLATRKELVGLEVGVDKGINAYNILSNLDIKKLYLIDPYFPQEKEPGLDGERAYKDGEYRFAKKEAEKLLDKFGNKIEWIIKTTEKGVRSISDYSLDFVYIDGCHRYESVKKDIELCYPKVKNGGMIAGHDFTNTHPGVVKAWIEKFGINNLFVGNIDVWVIKKR